MSRILAHSINCPESTKKCPESAKKCPECKGGCSESGEICTEYWHGRSTVQKDIPPKLASIAQDLK